MCEDACNAASVGDLEVEIGTSDGHRVRGIPRVGPTSRREPAAPAAVCLGGDRIALDAIQEFVVRAP